MRNKVNKFVIKDGVLHYIANDGLRQWITEAGQQWIIIQACHAELGGQEDCIKVCVTNGF